MNELRIGPTTTVAPITHFSFQVAEELASPAVARLTPQQAAYNSNMLDSIQELRGLGSMRPSTLTQEEWETIQRSQHFQEVLAQSWGLVPPPGYAPDADLSFQQVLATLLTELGEEFSLENIVALAESDDPEVRAAAQALLANPNYLNALDMADGKGDKKFSRLGLVGALVTEMQAEDGLLTPEQTAELLNNEKVFKALDVDGDKAITRQDLEELARDPDQLTGQARKVFDALTGNQNTFNALDASLMGDEGNGKITEDDVLDMAWGPTQESDNVWSLRDDIALDAALGQEGAFGDELFTAFDQGSRGNCASIAVVKAAMDKFGNDVFQNVERTDDGGYRVVMQDGYVVELTREEMEAAAQASDFQGGDPEACAYATLCFAAMAKRAQADGHDGSTTYAEALWSLTTGEYTAEVPEWIGLQDRMRPIDESEIGDYSSGVVGYGNGHAVYIDSVGGESYVDLWTYDHDELIPLDELADNTSWKGPELYFVFE